MKIKQLKLRYQYWHSVAKYNNDDDRRNKINRNVGRLLKKRPQAAGAVI